MPENKQIILVSINNKYEFGNYPVIQFIQNGQKKVFDYSNPYFFDVLEYLIENFDNKNIFINGKKEELENCFNIGSYKLPKLFYQSKNLLNEDSLHQKINIYLPKILKPIIETIKPDSNIIFSEIKGYKNRYVIPVNIDEKQEYIAFNVKQHQETIKIKLTNILDEIIPITGEINFQNNCVYISWNTPNDEILGSIVYSSDEKGNENIIKTQSITTEIEEENNLTAENKNQILNYLSLTGLIIPENIVKTSNNSYFLYSLKEHQNQIYTLINAHVITNKNIVTIDYYLGYGQSPLSHYLFSPVEEYRFEIILSKINENELLIQRKFISKDKTPGIYKKNSEKYSYELINLKSKKNYTFSHEINSLTDIDKQKEENKIQKLIEKQETGVKIPCLSKKMNF